MPDLTKWNINDKKILRALDLSISSLIKSPNYRQDNSFTSSNSNDLFNDKSKQNNFSSISSSKNEIENKNNEMSLFKYSPKKIIYLKEKIIEIYNSQDFEINTNNEIIIEFYENFYG